LAGISTAAAQGCGPYNPSCIVPTRPTGDNTNAAASTAFVIENTSNFAAPPVIGTTTPNAANFTSISATTITVTNFNPSNLTVSTLAASTGTIAELLGTSASISTMAIATLTVTDLLGFSGSISTLTISALTASSTTATWIDLTTLTWSGTPAYPGTATNNNASSGNIGEIISATVNSGSASSLSSGVFSNIASISLTPGDWDVSGQCVTMPAASTAVSQLFCTLNTVSVTANLTPGYFAWFSGFGVVVDQTLSQELSPARFSLATTTVVYLEIDNGFASSTESAYGMIRARRVR
jgi:hypothetical protein